jgi:ABC-type phosphate transport system substrate-binding protein
MKQFLVLLLCLAIDMRAVFAAEPQVLAEKNIADKQLSKYDLINIFTRKKQFWSDGHKIKVFTKPTDSLEHRMFTISVLNITPYKYRTLLDSVIYSGANNSVNEISSDAEMLTKLAATPYSIGYVNYTIIVNSNSQLIEIKYD